MTETDFVPNNYSNKITNGSVTWQAPSNIALVKYWGKKANQIPENPSISFTLNSCKTITTLHYTQKNDADAFSFDVFLDGVKKEAFKSKIVTFFERIERYVPFLKNYYFKIETSNTFPHSSGIASSASGMSALALCLMSIEQQLVKTNESKTTLQKEFNTDYFNKKASFLARLGSGSACRSIEGNVIVWGKHENIKNSSNFFGTKYPYAIHQNFENYQDTILLVDQGEKQVSSTLGHNLMHNHPFAKQRFKQAHKTINTLKIILKSGDLEAFIGLIESEALSLHAMMMTSMPYFILMKPNTLEIINKIWTFRSQSKCHIGFTLDAGANVHILYPEKDKSQVLEFIKTELIAYCQNSRYICDTVGFGAKQG